MLRLLLSFIISIANIYTHLIAILSGPSITGVLGPDYERKGLG